ncbi:MOSC domain-containing protein [Microvirga tunisiensis]|uniref:MOSC domain-containing protein n=1 Tax=Pannonibacter tanglangensis TaxID=2750084 RepID=A0A7X5EZF5_9HYPH|nr:MOSC domain-containing protein [Pannonibacter sp. XCT-53]NBN76903.1 MOSC domain-containing protein [Pannonibacter sp. XCT-53]
MTQTLEATILAVFTGKARDRWEGKAPSAIAKEAATGPLWLSATGLAGDEQADRAVHGGPEKALHHYAADHMSAWASTFPDSAEFFRPGCFGENIASLGLTETTLCLGDVLELDGATVQICQGRQPCWKLNLHTGQPAMAPSFQKTGRTGWYYRVLAEGSVAAGGRIRLIDRPHGDWPLARLIAARFDPRLDPAVAAELAGLPVLAESWRTAFARKVDPAYTENTDRRLKG